MTFKEKTKELERLVETVEKFVNEGTSSGITKEEAANALGRVKELLFPVPPDTKGCDNGDPIWPELNP